MREIYAGREEKGEPQGENSKGEGLEARKCVMSQGVAGSIR